MTGSSGNDNTSGNTEQAGAAIDPDVGYPPPNQVRWVVIAVLTGVLLSALDQTVVATALPRIVSEIGGLDQLAWVVTSYLLTSMAVTAVWGKLSDLYGRRSMFQAAIGVFVVGSALCGVAQNMVELIVFRGLQGVGAGGLYVLALSIIADVVPPRQRGKYQGYFVIVYGVASVGGPLVGGWLADGPGWRWIFLLNVPLGLASFVAATVLLPRSGRRQRHQVDFLGAILIIASISALLLYLDWAGDRFGWAAPASLGLLVAFAVLTGLLLAVERRAPEPIIPLHLFANRLFSIGNVFGFMASAAMFSGIVFLPVFLQVVLGMSPVRAGLGMLPAMVGIGLTSALSGALVSKTGRYRIYPIIGAALLVVSLIPLLFLAADTPYWEIAVVGFFFGAGVGFCMQTIIVAVQNSVAPSDIGSATSTTNLFQRMGATIGVAVLGAVLASRLSRHLVEQGLGAAGSVNARDIQVIRHLPDLVKGHAIQAYVASITDVFVATAPFVVIAFLVSLLLPEMPQAKAAPASPSSGQPPSDPADSPEGASSGPAVAAGS